MRAGFVVVQPIPRFTACSVDQLMVQLLKNNTFKVKFLLKNKIALSWFFATAVVLCDAKES